MPTVEQSLTDALGLSCQLVGSDGNPGATVQMGAMQAGLAVTAVPVNRSPLQDQWVSAVANTRAQPALLPPAPAPQPENTFKYA
jgi:hypothetical protein